MALAAGEGQERLPPQDLAEFGAEGSSSVGAWEAGARGQQALQGDPHLPRPSSGRLVHFN